ncbi:putative myosin-11 [Apostichopus japonicus]|uniref:Putative myosin-11 n=1 Tax=Stichopus japonicus TaxID=307972 RepID=A0A2G8JU17_STIJA|nr:putative myosin-11 [Apostichopus japonicus]
MTQQTHHPVNSGGIDKFVHISPREYNKWQRTSIPSERKSAEDADSSSEEEDTTFVVGRVDRRPKKTHQERHSCIYRAHHRSGPEAPKDDPNVDALKEVKILNLLIKSRLKALQSYRAREESLLEENAKMRIEIEQQEKDVHGKVTSLLQKYERYRGAVTTLTTKFEREKAQAKGELHKAMVFTKQELAVLDGQVKNAEDNLTMKKQELSMLMSYKDRDYPVSAMHISQLQLQISSLRQRHKKQHIELESMVELEKMKYKQQQVKELEDLKEDATNDVMDTLQDGLKEMALQNIT